MKQSRPYGYCLHCHLGVYFDTDDVVVMQDSAGHPWRMYLLSCGCRVTREQFENTLRSVLRDHNTPPSGVRA